MKSLTIKERVALEVEQIATEEGVDIDLAFKLFEKGVDYATGIYYSRIERREV